MVAVDIEQASGAQSAPHATKTCANDQNALFHFLLQGKNQAMKWAQGSALAFSRRRLRSRPDNYDFIDRS
jgi:hypothetical protein